MKNNIFVLDLTAMPTFIYAHLGALVFTPNIIYFISTGEVIKSSRGWPALISKIDYVLNEKSKIDFKQFENIDNYIEKLDEMALKNKGSVKINKFDIKSIKLPSGHFSYNISIVTQDKKYRFSVAQPILGKKLPELKTYLDNNMYILK